MLVLAQLLFVQGVYEVWLQEEVAAGRAGHEPDVKTPRR